MQFPVNDIFFEGVFAIFLTNTLASFRFPIEFIDSLVDAFNLLLVLRLGSDGAPLTSSGEASDVLRQAEKCFVITISCRLSCDDDMFKRHDKLGGPWKSWEGGAWKR